MKEKLKSINQITKIAIISVITTIIFCTASIGAIHILDSNNNVIASREGKIPIGYFCENHGWTAAAYYKYVNTGTYSNSSRLDLICCYIFGTKELDSDPDRELILQEAFWKARSKYAGNCEIPVLDPKAKSLYNKAENYADIMLSSGLGKETIKDANTTARVINDGKYYYDFALIYSDALNSSTKSNSDGGKTFEGNVTAGDKVDNSQYYSGGEKTKSAVDIYKINLTFSYTSSDIQKIKDDSLPGSDITSFLYIKDNIGMKHNLDQTNSLENWKDKATQNISGDYYIAKVSGNMILLQKKTNSKGVTYYQEICTVNSTDGKKSAEISVVYEKAVADNEEISNIGFGDHSESGSKLFYIKTVKINAIGKDGKEITKNYTSDSELQSILKSSDGNRLFFEVEVDENLYDATSLKITVEYENCTYSGTYSEYEGCYSNGTFTGATTQRLMKPDVTKEWTSYEIELDAIKSGNRYIDVEIDKYEGSKASEVSEENLLTGAAFTLKKGYFNGKTVTDINRISYSDAKNLFNSVDFETSKASSQTRKEWTISENSKFNWEEIKLTIEDIEEKKYVVFEITENPPEGYVGVNKFYIVANIIDLDSNNGYYYLSNLKILYDEENDKDKILFETNEQTSTETYTIKPVIKVANPNKGNGNLQLLKVDEKGVAINNVKFDVTVTKYKNGAQKGSDETFTLTTANKELAIGEFLNITGKTDGVAEKNTELSDIDAIKFTVKEQDHSQNSKLPEYLSVIPEFTMEFGVKIENGSYVLSNTYVDSSKNTYTKAFKYNGKIVNFNKTVNGVESYVTSDGNVTIGIKDPNTKDASIRLIMADETVSFNLDLTKSDIGTSNLVKDVGFDIKVTRVDKNNYSSEKGTIYQNKSTLYTDESGKIQVNELKNLSLKNVDVNNEYIKVTITETNPPKVEEDEYYDVVNDGRPFSFIAQAEKSGEKIYLTKIIDTIDWPENVDGIQGYAEIPTIDENNLSVKVNIRDKYKHDSEPYKGQYGIKILKTDLNEKLISGKNPAEFEIKVNNKLIVNKNPVSGKGNTIFVATDGLIELDYENYPELELKDTTSQTVAIREVKAPDIDGDGEEDYKKINNGNWFTATAEVSDYGTTYRLNGNYSKSKDWPVAVEENKGDAKLAISNNYVFEVTAKNEKIKKDGTFSINLLKSNEDNKPLGGATFHVEIKADGSVLQSGNYTTSNTGGAFTISDVVLKTGMKEITIEFTETKAPSGYELVNSGETFKMLIPVEETEDYIRISNKNDEENFTEDISATINNNYRVVVDVIDRKKEASGEYDISLHKVNEKNNKALKDAWFKISVIHGSTTENLKNPSPVEGIDDDIFVTDSSGNITTGKIALQLGKDGKPEDQRVIITEVKAPAGYLPINDGAPIEVTLKVKQSGNKLVLDRSSDHIFFPLNYTEDVSNNNYSITKLPESPITYNLKMYKQFKNNDGTVRKATFEVTDVINGDTYEFNNVDTSGENSQDIQITDKNSSGIKLKVKELTNSLNSGWGTIPEFYLEIPTKSNGAGSYVIDTSKSISVSPVNSSDSAIFDLIKEQLLKITVSSDGTSISIVAINPLEGNINIKLNKYDADANNENMKDVKFKVTIDGVPLKDSSGNEYFMTNADGIISIPNVKVTSAVGKIELGIHELTVSEGNDAIKYYKEIPDFTITLNKTLENQIYTVTNEYSTNLSSSSKVTVNITGDSTSKLITISVPNERRIMRLSGQVWKDVVSSGKVSEVNGQKDSKESFINGITVKVHASNGSDILTKYANIVEDTEKKTSTQNVKGTSKEGYYYFDVPMYDGEYYIEYVYNGYKYQHTLYTPWNGKGVYSNATETENDRDELNNKFTIINSGSVNNQINSTSETDTSYNGVNIRISAFTGGFGKNNLVTFSARKNDSTEGKCNNKTGADNSSKYVDGSSKNQTIDSKIYDYVFDNINLGITSRESVRLQLAKAVNRVKFQVTKPTGEVISQTYRGKKYGQDEYEKIDENTTAYIGEIEVGVRPEDEYTIDGTAKNANLAADVHTYITYRLHLINNSSELGVQFNDIVDYYDSSLVLQSVILAKEDGTKISDVANSTKGDKTLKVYNSKGSDSGTTKSNFKELHITPNIKVAPNATYYIDVTFEMPTIPDNIIQSSDSAEVIESKLKINVAEVNSYTTYYVGNGINSGNRYSYNEHVSGDIAGIFDQDSNPGNVIGLRKTGIAVRPYIAYPHEKDDGIAFAEFIENEERKLSGKVWKENRNNKVEDAVIGNGEYESGEEGYAGVKVQLYDNDTGNIANVYYSATNTWNPAIERTTDLNGNYEAFNGIAPGNYYLLFTYPDGQTYKSTIFAESSQSSFDANNPDVTTSTEFDLNSNDSKSHARDLLGNDTTAKTRKYVNNLLAAEGEINHNSDDSKDIKDNYDNYINGNNYIEMNAISSLLKLGFETDRNNTDTNITTYDSLDHWGGITWEYTRKNHVANINLGVVERPVTQLQITKNVANVKLTLASGNVLFDASDRATNVQWIKPHEYSPSYDGAYSKILQTIDNNTTDNIPNWRAAVTQGNINLTMDEELMQGATMKIKYNITVTNIGEVDYSDNEFYYKGTESDKNGNIVTTTVGEIVDYVGYQRINDEHVTRNNLNYVESDNESLNWNYKTVSDLTGEGKLSNNAAYGEDFATLGTVSTKGANAYNTIIVNDLNTGLVPKVFEGSGNNHVDKELTLSKMISSNGSDDFTYNNMVEIISLKNEVGRRSKYSTVGNQDPTSEYGPSEVDTDEAQEVTIGEPYGQTQIPYMLCAGVAIILILGVSSIIIIRKKTSKE